MNKKAVIPLLILGVVAVIVLVGFVLFFSGNSVSNSTGQAFFKASPKIKTTKIPLRPILVPPPIKNVTVKPAPVQICNASGPINYFIKGSVTVTVPSQGYVKTYADTCMNDITLLKYYCPSGNPSSFGLGNYYGTESYNCLYGCKDGACLQAALPPQTKDGCFLDGSCYRCKKNDKLLISSCYSEEECKPICAKMLSAACNFNEDCDDGNKETVDMCENPSTDTAKCTHYNSQCMPLVKTGDASKNINIVFIPEKITDLDAFQSELPAHINAILSAKPFSSEKGRMNFYFVKVSANFGFVDGNANLDKAKLFAKSCEGSDEIIITEMVLPNTEIPFTEYAGRGEHLAVSNINDPFTTLHEFGHSFGGLSDTYVGWMPFNGAPQVLLPTAPNVDTAGCPKWCQSNTGIYQTACTQITDEQECRQHERWGGSDNLWSCSDPLKCCVWLPEPDPFFKTRCINFRDNKNIGINCLGTSGCFFGANGQGAWRSVESSSGTNSVMNERGVMQFGDVEKAALNKLFDCCYPQSCSAPVPQECSQLASAYSSFQCTPKCGSK